MVTEKTTPEETSNKKFSFPLHKVWVDREIENHNVTLDILSRIDNTPIEVIDNVRSLKHETDISKAKKEIILTKHRGRAFKPCQGIPTTPLFEQKCVNNCHAPFHLGQNIGNDHICCCYYIIDLISGCPMECSYCILQHYLANNPRCTIYVNIDEILKSVQDFLDKHKNHFFRIGTGELSDSLALDHLTNYSQKLISFFASQSNALLELKTKTDTVDHLLKLDHNEHTVFSWSVNTKSIIAQEEEHSAPLEKRLIAAKKCASAKYKVGFHFDPIIITRNSDEEFKEYEDVINMIFDYVDPDQIAWVSLGLLRLPYAMKAIVQRRFPTTRIFGGELVPAGNKLRYLRFLREKYYKPLWDRLSRYLPQDKIYLCMETETIWKKIDPSIKSHVDLEGRLIRRHLNSLGDMI